MRSTLDAFLTDVKDLEIFVDSIKGVYGALARDEDVAVRACINIRRRLDYAAFVMALYAALERFVDDLAWSHAELESSLNEYPDLCDQLRKKHVRQSADLLRRGRLGEGRYEDVSEIDIVKNLHACLSGENPYTLNRHAVVHHDHNLRSQVVQGMFSSLGIQNINRLASRIESLINWFCASGGIEPSSIEEVPLTVVELRLKDLVERRNEVAHGGAHISESLDTDEMRIRLRFLEAYARSLFAVLASTYLGRYYIKPRRATSLGPLIEGPYKDRFVVVVRKPPCRVFVGQPIIGVRINRVDRWGEVLEIQVEGVSVESVEVDSAATTVGLRANFKFTKGIEVYALETKDDVIWG